MSQTVILKKLCIDQSHSKLRLEFYIYFVRCRVFEKKSVLFLLLLLLLLLLIAFRFAQRPIQKLAIEAVAVGCFCID